jgi:thiamine monophosphate synthase
MITLITDRLLCETSIVAKIKTLVEEKKINQVILREKDLNDTEFYYLYILHLIF